MRQGAVSGPGARTRGRRRDHATGRGKRAAWPFWLLAAWLVIVFAAGGSARADIQSLLFLQPLAFIVLGAGLCSIRRCHLRARAIVFALAAALILLMALQLVPLPPAFWRSLPGRDLPGAIDDAVALGATWRPLTMTPQATREALWSLVNPLAVLVLGAQMNTREQPRLVALFLALGLASGFLALVQIAGPDTGPAYLYRITNNGFAVGLFANRNHQAVFLAMLIPLALAWRRLASDGHRVPTDRKWLEWLPAAVYLLFIVPLVLVTGSRSGTIVASIALLAAPALFWKLDDTGRTSGRGSAKPTGPGTVRLVAAVGAVLTICTLAAVLGRAVSFERFFAQPVLDDMRVRILPTVYAMIEGFFPVGAGFGSFPQVYQVYEPDALLMPTYMNHAHNDWLELALEGGAPAVLLLASALIALFAAGLRRSFAPGVDARRRLLARLGALALLQLAIASLSDYPVRVPSLAAFAVLAMLWSTLPADDRSHGNENEGTYV